MNIFERCGSISEERVTRRQFIGKAIEIAIDSTALLVAGYYQPSPPAEATPAPTTPPTEESPKTLEKKENRLFNILLQPFIKEAESRRADRARNDREYSRRVDQDLNRNRLNFLLFGYGETYEPGRIEKPGNIIGSPTIVSIDYTTNEIFIISMTHDIRAPEVEAALGTLSKDKRPEKSAKRIDRAFLEEGVGGFDLMRMTLEDATGLSIDFQMALDDVAIQKLVDNVFGEIVVDIPMNMRLGAYYHLGKLYDEEDRQFYGVPTKLNGREAVGFIKAVAPYGPRDGSSYSPLMEHNKRKVKVFEGLWKTIKAKFTPNSILAPAEIAKFFWYIHNFLNSAIANKEIAFDFDATDLLLNNISHVAGELTQAIASGKSLDMTVPSISDERYIVSPECSTDPGNPVVHWESWSRSKEAKERWGENELAKDLEAGVYDEALGYEVPYGGNPYGDLISEYWQTMRQYVKQFLTKEK